MRTKGKGYRYIFGPVPSRRLGQSLGIDVVPFKTCSYDCIYCQLGRTTHKTVERKEYLPTSEILEEIDRKLEGAANIDYVTFSGSGEPTLHKHLGEMIAHIKKRINLPVAVLTNGGLFPHSSVREAILNADLIIPSLDAGDRRIFQKINRPHRAVQFKEMVEGLIRLRDEFRGQIWLEVFLVSGINNLESEVEKISQWVNEIKPDRIQLNTIERPPAERFALRCSEEDLLKLSRLFDGNVEIISGFRAQDKTGEEKRKWTEIIEEVTAIIRRRPCRLDDLSHGLGLHRNEILKYITILTEKGVIKEYRQEGEIFYKIIQ